MRRLSHQRDFEEMVIGGGPIGLELAQAFRGLGCDLSIIEMLDPLFSKDPELVNIVVMSLKRAGTIIHA